MPTLVVLATADTALAEAWQRQLPAGRSVIRVGIDPQGSGTSPGFSAVVILDSAAELGLPSGFSKCPTIYVGEPRTGPFEQARLSGRAKVYLSYDESTSRLGEFLPLVDEIAEKQSMLDLFIEKAARKSDAAKASSKVLASDSSEWWDFLEGAVESMDSRERLLAEFRRASRPILRASHAVFFLREGDLFRADRGTSIFGADDPLVSFFEAYPAVVDGGHWDGPGDPIAEITVRNRLAMWGARLLVPIHDNGKLLGLIALGVREDGQPYDEADRGRAIFIARLLRHFLAKSAIISRLSAMSDRVGLGARYLPTTLILEPSEAVPRHVPLVIRDLIGQVRRTKEICRVQPAYGQPFRGSSGIIAETGGVWAFWEEASGELHDAAVKQRMGRRGIIKELALTLSHELGNSLVSLSLLRQGDAPLTNASLLETIKKDISKLEALNRSFGIMQSLHEVEPVRTNVSELIRSIGSDLGLRVEMLPDAVHLSIAKELVDFALRSLVQTVTENRPMLGTSELGLQLRSAGEGKDLTVLISIKGGQLELEGILPEPTDSSIPNQGRIGVFIAKEVLRLHHGEIHAGPGIQGTEILISMRSL